MVHFSTSAAPGVNAVMVVFGLFRFVIAAVPETMDQVPVPEGGVFPGREAVVTSHKFSSADAAATEEGAPLQ